MSSSPKEHMTVKMSSIPPPDPPNNKPIPKEALKFLRVSPSVKVMPLKKSSTTCRVKESQGRISSNPLAGASSAVASPASGHRDPPIMMRPVHKERKMISVLSTKSVKKEEAKILEKRDIGDKQDSMRNVNILDKKSSSTEKQKHWVGRWLGSLFSALK